MKKINVLLSSLAFISFSLSAQETARFITTSESEDVYRSIEENAPGNPNLRDVPRFTLVGKDSKFYLGMGANVKMVGDFDWGSPISNPNSFAPKDIPMSVDPGDKGQTLFSVGQSNIYWNFVALPGTKNQLGLFFDIIFLGNSSKPVIEIHHLYMKYRGFTAGYVVSTFTDLKAEPKSIDFAGPNAITFVRHPNIYYTYKFGKDKLWTAQLGLDMPDIASFTNSSATKMVNQRMPDIPFFIQRSWADNKGWLRASAIVRDLQYHYSFLYGGTNGTTEGNHGVFGWGVKLDGKSPLGGGWSAAWQGVYGKGIASYIQDLRDEGLDLMPTDKHNLQAVPVWGAYGSIEYAFGKCGFINFTYSQVRSYAKNTSGYTDLYKYGQYLTSNLIFNVSSFAQVGVEYLWGRRMNYSGQQAHDNRIMLMLNLSI